MDTREPEQFTMRDVMRAAGVGARAVRSWVAGGLLPAPMFRSYHTRYGAAYVERARLIGRLRREGLMGRRLRERLALEDQSAAAAREAALVAAAAEAAVVAAAAEAAAVAGAESAGSGDGGDGAKPPEDAPVPSTATMEPPAAATARRELWERTVLLPGIELLVDCAASEIIQRIAAEIRVRYGAKAGGDR